MDWGINLVISMKISRRISLILLLVVFLSGALIAVLAAENTNNSFDEYINETYNVMLSEWGQAFATYYVRNDYRWQGVERLFVFDLQSGVVLSDLQGNILYHYDKSYIGKDVPTPVFRRGYPLQLDGETIGILYPAALFNATVLALEKTFVQTTIFAVIKGTIFTSLFAAIIGLGLSTGITFPLKDLIRAAERMAKGKFDEPLPVYSNDEIGDLARSFNTMAQELEKGIDLRKQMTADISHELRTPLTVLANKLEFSLEQNRPLSTEDTVILYDEVIRLRGLVNELQDMSKLEAGHMSLEKTLVDFQQYFEEFFMLLEAEAENRAMTLNIVLAEHLPPCYADAKRLKQVVLNLVNNAFRYTPDGGTIIIDVSYDQQDFIIQVSDSGIGIAPEDMDYIFERFYRADRSRDRETGGSGLGLAITKALVESHGGTIQVESKLDIGSRFTVRLPLWQGEAE